MKKFVAVTASAILLAACSESTAPVAQQIVSPTIREVTITSGGSVYDFEAAIEASASPFTPYARSGIPTSYSDAATGFSSGNWYGGRYTNEVVTFTVDYAAGSFLYYDLYIIGTWDGISKNYGPDQWQLAAYCGPTASGNAAAQFTTTFSNKSTTKQNYPAQIGGQVYPGTYAAFVVGELGFVAPGETRVTNKAVSSYDAVYRMSAAFPNCSAGTTSLTFVMQSPTQQLQATFDEGWGIDNVSTSGFSASSASGYNQLF